MKLKMPPSADWEKHYTSYCGEKIFDGYRAEVRLRAGLGCGGGIPRRITNNLLENQNMCLKKLLFGGDGFAKQLSLQALVRRLGLFLEREYSKLMNACINHGDYRLDPTIADKFKIDFEKFRGVSPKNSEWRFAACPRTIVNRFWEIA